MRAAVLAAVLAAAGFVFTGADASAGSRSTAPPTLSHLASDTDLSRREWVWPLAAFRVERPYEAPAGPYAPGHRGVDLRPLDDVGVLTPASGIVAFSGRVADRAVLTIDHGDGLVTTLEPIDSPLTPGTAVDRGALVGTVALGGHTPPGAVHFGVRLRGEYINPLLLLGGVPRAVLLPCC